MADRGAPQANRALEAYAAAIDWLADAPDSDILSTSVREVIAEAAPGTARLDAAREGVRTMAMWRIEGDTAGAAAIYREAKRVVAGGPTAGDPRIVSTAHVVVAAFRTCRWPSNWELEWRDDFE
jgi:hypothetical protein